ncbi:response regulator transcription factor [Pararhizobium sp.]|uniref:response regulator transcription factor n=1 Tax=Pararhizobium sp. TaxID=1977563 RepID=UPI002715B919|nr:response regulator transcription factor [Pararhizobium sp.]MDO9418387.1 response regulator transcription factor [Pararhizobium sp.]
MNQSAVKILVVDDEQPIRRLLDVGLSSQGYAVQGAHNARTAIEMAASDPPDLVLLDLGLPDMRGHELLARWRAENVPFPIVILSSRTDEAGIVEALDLGADDYVTKPFGMNELVARIRVALRHRLQTQGETPLFHAGDLVVDLVKRVVKVRGEEVKLTPKEYDILRLFVQHSGRVLTHRFILEKVWGEIADVQYLRVYIRQLRQKIEESPDQPRHILTETGVGYRLAEIATSEGLA